MTKAVLFFTFLSFFVLFSLAPVIAPNCFPITVSPESGSLSGKIGAFFVQSKLELGSVFFYPLFKY